MNFAHAPLHRPDGARWPLRTLVTLALSLSCGAAALAQTTYWMGRQQGTNYVFDVPVAADFAEPLLAVNPAQYLVEQNPKGLPRGPVPLAKVTIVYDAPMLKRGSVAVERKDQNVPMLWIHNKLNQPGSQPLLAQLPTPPAGQWNSVPMMLAIAPDARPLNLSVPVPPDILAVNRMKELAQQTRPGRYYPGVKVPADLDGYRQQMLNYGNAGRRDPDFRKDNGAKTVLDLSRDTQDVYADQSKTRKIQEQVFRVNKSPPYFADHVLNARLNEAAQFQAEYNASIDNATHDGPRSFTDPASGQSADLSTLGKRAQHFGVRGVVEGAGSSNPGGAPHNWMASDTHFRPFFNVSGCHDEMGYGAAQSASGKWYFIMVPRIDPDPACTRTGGASATKATATVTATPTPATPTPATPTPAPQAPVSPPPTATAEASVFPLKAETRFEPDRRYPSPSGRHYLVFQRDGNLVVYTRQHQPVWALNSLTPNWRKNGYAIFQADGNLATYQADKTYVWSARHVVSPAGTTLTLNDQGELQIVGPDGRALWTGKAN
jgi:hypothetical protein